MRQDDRSAALQPSIVPWPPRGHRSRNVVAAVLVSVALGGLGAAFPSQDPDVWFHLALGRQMAESGGIPATETLCLVSEGHPFINHEWLYDLGLWGLHETFGTTGWTGLRVAFAAALMGLAALLAMRMGAAPVTAVLAVVLTLPVVRPWLDVRPHMPAYVLALVFVHLLWGRGRPGVARVLGMALVAAVWTNVHGSFPLAPVLAGMRVLRPGTGESRRDRAGWAAAALVVGAMTLANPWGPALYATVMHHGTPVYRLLTEWAPWPFGLSVPRDLCYLLLVGGALAGFLARGRRRALDELGLLLVFLAPALSAEKFVPGLAVAATPILAVHLSRVAALRSPVVVVVAFAALTAAVVTVHPGAAFGGGVSYVDEPREAMGFARESGLRGRVFHPFNNGGYVTFTGQPDLQPFIDGRIYIHDADGVSTYLGALERYEAFQALQARFGFSLVMADRQDVSFGRLIEGLSRDADFRMIWLDDRFVLWIPAGERKELAAFQVLKPGTDPRYLFDLPDAALPRAAEEVERVRATGRGDETAALAGGLLGLRRAGLSWAPTDALRTPVDPAPCLAAETDLGRLAERRPDVAMFGYFHAVALACSGRCDEAAAAARSARAFPDARDLASRLGAGECPAR